MKGYSDEDVAQDLDALKVSCRVRYIRYIDHKKASKSRDYQMSIKPSLWGYLMMKVSCRAGRNLLTKMYY